MSQLKSDLSNLNKVIASVHKTARINVRRYTFKVQNLAQQYVPKQTTAAENSIHVVLDDFDGHDTAVLTALELRPEAEVFWETEQVDGPLNGKIVVGVGYGWVLEMGSTKVSARPYLSRAMHKIQQEYFDSFKNLIERDLSGMSSLSTSSSYETDMNVGYGNAE